MKFIIKPMKYNLATKLVTWKYDPPYDVYNVVSDDLEAEAHYYADAANQYYSLETDNGDFVAFCCFGQEGRVPGGDYSTQALDIGVGVRPDLTGKGMGVQYVEAILAFAAKTFETTTFRATIAKFNQRSQRVFQKLGFDVVDSFMKRGTRNKFIILIKLGSN